MSIMRSTALRSLQIPLRHSTARATARTARGRTPLVARRYASSGGHGSGHGEASSDLPWMLGALAITPPACWYLWPDTPHAEHHGAHGAHDDQSHSEEKQEEEGGGGGGGGGGEAQHEKSEQTEEKSDDNEGKPSDTGGESQAESATEKAGGEDTTEQKGDDSENEDGAGKADESKSQSSSSQDPRIKRINPSIGKSLDGSSASQDDDSDASKKDSPKTNAKHSMQIDQMDNKSKKGSGGPETAKATSTVDSSAPLVSGPNKK